MRWSLCLIAPLLVLGCDRGAPRAGAEASSSAGAASPSGLALVGTSAPDIEGVAQNGDKVRLADFRGRPVVVYFYPKDDTPGCTAEAQGMRDEWTALQAAKAVVIGVSTDSADSHRAFTQKYELPFLLLPDPDAKIARAFGVPVHLGFAKRVTFVIDKQGRIAKVFPDVSPKGHAQEVLAVLRGLSG